MKQDLSTRRRFLGTPAALAMPALLSAQSPNDTVRVAFIGVGNRGAFLLRHMQKVPGVTVVAIADINADTLAAVAAAAAAAGSMVATYADYRRMLEERKDIDAVVIATPSDTHKDIAISSLEVGKHVYLEKPMAHTLDQSRMIVNAAKSAKGIFQLGLQLRFEPNRRASMEFIHKGGLGKILLCQGYRHTGDIDRNITWYFNASRSGDNLVEQAVHILDLFVWAIGKPPLRVMGSGGISLYKDQPPGRTTMDNYSLIYEFPDDVRVNFSHIYFDPPGFSGIRERVYGANGAIDLARALWIEHDKKGEIKLEVPNAGQDASYLSLASFIDNARGRKMPLNNADTGHLSTMVAMMGRTAIYEKRIVTWKEFAG